MSELSKSEDLKLLAICHRLSFPGSLSSKLGPSYVKKMLSWYLEAPQGFMIREEIDGKIVGYCGGFVVDGSMATGSASAMMQHSFNDAVKSLFFRPWLLLHPEMLLKYRFALRNLWYRVNPPKKPLSQIKSEKHRPYTGLVVIGVDPSFQGKGLGSKLLQGFEDQTRALGIKEMKLTVKASNKQAIRAYERNGWIKAELHGTSLSMSKTLVLDE